MSLPGSAPSRLSIKARTCLPWPDLECGSPIELDDYVIENTGNRGKVIGAIAAAVVPKIVEAIKASPDVRASDKQAMLAALGFVWPRS